MNTEFLRITTEDKLILQGIIYTPETKGQKVYLHIHGMAGNFYENRFLDAMVQELTDAGYAFMSINTRGHDLISDFPLEGSGEQYKRIGNAYEKFEECVLDIRAGIDYCAARGYTEIILCGHSLGAAKVAYYSARTHDSRIQKLILMSPPDMVRLAENESYHKDLLARAQQMVSDGRGEELLPTKIWDGYHLCARTYVDLSSRDYPVDVFNVYDPEKASTLANIGTPIFAIIGEKDDATAGISPRNFLEIIKKKASAAPQCDTTIIEGAPHSYFAHEKEMADAIVRWLAL